MGTFNTQALLKADPSLIPAIAAKMVSTFKSEGFLVENQMMYGGSADISISKGNIFKAVLGMRSALKVSLAPRDGCIAFDASVGIFGQQVIPTLIMWFYAWPVMITQIWGLIKQSKLDDKALAIAAEVIEDSKTVYVSANRSCSGCGNSLPKEAVFCPACGKRSE